MTVNWVGDAEFTDAVQGSKWVLVDFTAPWCAPCRKLLPLLDELAEELEETAIYKVNVEEASETAARFGVQSMPTVLAFRDGEPIGRLVGLRPKEAYRQLLKE